MNTVKVKGMKPIVDKLKIMSKYDAAKSVVPVGDTGVMLMKERTDTGYMVVGGRFPDYSPQYAIVRQKAGLSLTTGRLSFTGEMMNQLQGVPTIDGVELMFASSEANKIAQINNARTKFFGFNEQERDVLMNEMRDGFSSYMRGK